MLSALRRGLRRARHFHRTLAEQGVPPFARLILIAQKAKQRLMPPGTRRLRFYRATFGRISGRFLRYAHRSWQEQHEKHPDLAEQPLVFDEVEVLTFQEHAQPKVSILIPVFEQWEVTYGCLRSILTYSGDRIPYEVLILDDCSQDEVQRLHEKTPGVRFIRNEENLRFLKNCNHGATFAKGEHLLLLNNDTLVHEGWLEAMVDRLESDPKIGLVGAKLIGADGILQEAGGIIFQDGSGWNYGRGEDPNHPAYAFFKETDYGSGACILIPRFLWQELGGFDERFAPAYYEDTDLAFAVRAAGYKVVYEPRAVVTHLEGISHGTDVASGMKRYQVENQAKFVDKWRDTLLAGQMADASGLDRAQCRGKDRPCVLIADYQVPHWDNEAGGRLTWMYVQLFLDLGFRVLYRPANLFPAQPYTAEMEARGVEVLHGPTYLDMDVWLKEHGHAIDYAYLHRPEVAVQLLEPLKKRTSAKLIYQCHDLHHMRYQRAWETAGNTGTCPESVRQKELEYGVIEACDIIHTPSTFERDLLHRAFPGRTEVIHDVPLFLYDRLPEAKLSTTGRDLIFVGGYGHPPNEDAVLWFVNEVMPLVLAQHPDAVLHLVGGGAGSRIEALASKSVRLHGRIDDTALEAAYTMADVAVVPLRYGAGVKGKVLEAMALGLPVVTTGIGAEGIPTEGSPLLVGETPEELAARIHALLDDLGARQNLSARGQEFIREHYSTEVAAAVLRRDFPHSGIRPLEASGSC